MDVEVRKAVSYFRSLLPLPPSERTSHLAIASHTVAQGPAAATWRKSGGDVRGVRGRCKGPYLSDIRKIFGIFDPTVTVTLQVTLQHISTIVCAYD